MSPKRLINLFRLLFIPLVLALLFYLQERPIPSSDAPIELYATATHDDLRKIYLDAIEQAKESIYLFMYSLSDEKMISALNQKAEEGVAITVIHDSSTDQSGFDRLDSIQHFGLEINGLMHQKILITDQEKVWIGSANFTSESLRLHDNLVAKVMSPELSKTLLYTLPAHTFTIGGQLFEMWILPEERREGLHRLLSLIEGARHSIRVAMYTWTHPELTEAIIRAHQRGVSVEVILDRGQANGVGRKSLKRLINARVPIWLSTGQKLLHHKCMWVDGEILVNGSANWTGAAFSRNKDCFFILHDLTKEQKAKLEQMWLRTRILSRKKELLGTMPLYEDLPFRIWQDGQTGCGVRTGSHPCLVA
jgi:phosphatidylserine/phosphatidylglycerophosphate/cardiolipin synthase-like enzyme